MNILSTIVKHKEKEVALLKEKRSKEELISASKEVRGIRDFKAAISKTGKLSVIGEVKRLSPSAGLLKKDFDPLSIALIYEKNGISALSVLTDEKFFGGKPDYVKKIKEKVKLPVLRKDFIIDEYQIYESFLAGADAVLLIAHILEEDNLKEFLELVHKLGMSSIVEVHDKKELTKALNCKPQIVGINNRDLETFEVDLSTTEKLFRFIPKKTIVVSESGIDSNEDLLTLKEIGVDAALIGEAFMKSLHLDKKIKKLLRGIS